MAVNPGEVEIELNGRKETLRSTLYAIRMIDTLGGMTDAFSQLAKFKFSAYVTIVAGGLEKKYSEVEGDVMKTGMPNLVESLSHYIAVLSNGGREPSDEGNKTSGEA